MKPGRVWYHQINTGKSSHWYHFTAFVKTEVHTARAGIGTGHTKTKFLAQRRDKRQGMIDKHGR